MRYESILPVFSYLCPKRIGDCDLLCLARVSNLGHSWLDDDRVQNPIENLEDKYI